MSPTEPVPGGPTPADGDRPLPLAGITVLDLGQVYQGPYAGFLLATAGARVVKVEHPRGETLRARGPSLPYALLNSCKETVTVDLKHPDGPGVLRRLAASADVVLVNYAPGVPERLGIGWDDLRAVNPSLIYAHGTGYGRDGVESAPAMDVTVQAHAGVMSVTGFPGSGPLKAGVPFIDFLSGTHLYGAITTALFERERTGAGREVEVAMADVALFTLASNLGSWHRDGGTPRTGNKHAALGVAPYDVYPCADGHLALIAVTNRHWRSVLDVVGRADLVDDDRYRHMADRATRMDEVDAIVTSWTATRPRDDAVALLQAARVPAAAVRTVDEVLNDARQHRRGALAWVDHPELGNVPLATGPIRFLGSRRRPVEASRAVGADTAAVLADLGHYAPAEIADLVDRGVV